jgi:tetratricopeptide (TPR) repeat protein
MKCTILIAAVFALQGAALDETELMKARDQQNRPVLEGMASEWRTIAEKQPQDAAAQYHLALAESYVAEVAIELRDKTAAKNAAQAGIDAAERAVALKSESSEYQRLLGTLCGQIISGNSLSALKYGKCALDAVNKAIELNPKASMNYVSRGVGNYYLPPAFGGGIDLAIQDFRKATELDAKNAEAWLWLGIAERKANQSDEARKAIQKSVALNPNRVWAKQQLDKTQ